MKIVFPVKMRLKLSVGQNIKKENKKALLDAG
jgi:hypothetical protein